MAERITYDKLVGMSYTINNYLSAANKVYRISIFKLDSSVYEVRKIGRSAKLEGYDSLYSGSAKETCVFLKGILSGFRFFMPS